MTLMKSKALITFLAVLAVSAPVSAQGNKSKNSQPVREIRAVLDRQVEAWNRGDLEGFMDGYWNSPDLTFYSGGTKTAGWKETLGRYRNTYQKDGAEMGQLAFTDIKIEMLGPASALVRGRWRLKMRSTEPNGLFTLIFRRLPAGWKIVHDHTGAST
ncbi:MAG TPA: nuclear transport factor 2 family protein [Blastocatellia bacterium]|nr:nuclear transport factor 2 family protein [Blastocatellia bacterium]